MRLDHFLIGMLIFSLFIVMGPLIISDINTNYGKDISTDDFNETYNAADELYDISKAMRNETMNLDTASEENWEGMTKGPYGAIRKVEATYGLFDAFVNELATTLSIPKLFVQMMYFALTIMVTFAVIYLVMRYKP